MNQTVNNLRLFLCSFSGEDDYIIRLCRGRIQVSYAAIGFFIILIFIGCLFSAYSFMDSLFHGSIWISIPVGIFWALLIANLYLLLIYTVSPTLLPAQKEKASRRKIAAKSDRDSKIAFGIAMVFRIGLISFLAVVIAQPLNVFFLSHFSEKSLNDYKTEYRINMLVTSDSSLIKKEIQEQRDFYHEVSIKATEIDSIRCISYASLLNDKVLNDYNFLFQTSSSLNSLKKLKQLKQTKVNIRKTDSIRQFLSTLVDDAIQNDINFKNEIIHPQFINKDLEVSFEKYNAGISTAIKSKLDNYYSI